MTATNDTIILTPALRAALSDVLAQALTGEAGQVARAGALGYLDLLASTRDGDALGDLIDVVEYFVIDLDALDA